MLWVASSALGGLGVVGCFFDSELCALFLHGATQSLFPALNR